MNVFSIYDTPISKAAYVFRSRKIGLLRFLGELVGRNGVLTQGFTLAKQAFFCLSHTSSLLLWLFLEMGGSQELFA
jgi:hypothetical protein